MLNKKTKTILTNIPAVMDTLSGIFVNRIQPHVGVTADKSIHMVCDLLTVTEDILPIVDNVINSFSVINRLNPLSKVDSSQPNHSDQVMVITPPIETTHEAYDAISRKPQPIDPIEQEIAELIQQPNLSDSVDKLQQKFHGGRHEPV